MSAIPIYVDSNLVCVMPDGSTEEMARDEIKRLKIIHGVDRVYTIGARNTGRGVMMALDGDAQTIATLRADLARVTAELAEANGALQALEVRMFDTVTTVESERDAARAQVRELLKVARAAKSLCREHVGLILRASGGEGDRFVDLVLALPPSMLEEPDPRDARIAELEAQRYALAEAVMDLNGGHPVSAEALDLACSVVLPDDAVLAVPT